VNQQGPTDEVGLFGHKLDGLAAGRRVVPHLAFTEEFIPGIQKFLVITVANQFVKLALGQTPFIQVARVELYFLVQQETSCFPACRSGRLLIEGDFRRHVFLRT
jgi:hypothetical protein